MKKYFFTFMKVWDHWLTSLILYMGFMIIILIGGMVFGAWGGLSMSCGWACGEITDVSKELHCQCKDGRTIWRNPDKTNGKDR